MTPGARIAAAMDILGDMSEGMAAEQALTRWARRSRFAGSKDRAAIRDHVFDLLRQRRSAAHFGKGDSPRALMTGLLHQQGADLGALFNGQGHAPEPLSPEEAEFPPPPTEDGILWNLPDWLVPEFESALGPSAEPTALALQQRAPVTLRVNHARADRDAVRERLAKGIALCEQHGDYVTRDILLAQMKDTEEDHTRWLERQLGLIEKIGLQNYLQSQMSA